jgi:hypothetical protein
MDGRRLLLVGLLAAALLLIGGCRDHDAEIRAVFTAYQNAVASKDGMSALAVTESGCFYYWGSWMRASAVSDTRDELFTRSPWVHLAVLVYRDQLGGEFLRSASPEQIYAKLVERGVLIRNVQGFTLGRIKVRDGEHADAELLKDGGPSGLSISFWMQNGSWKISSSGHSGIMHYRLRDLSKRPNSSREEVIHAMFRTITGRDPHDSLYVPPG